MAKVSQDQRVLRALQQRGAEGVTQVDFLSPVIDGGKPILRLAARIYNLRNKGHGIHDGGVRDGVCIYVLAHAERQVGPQPPVPRPQKTSAFDQWAA